MKNYIAYDLSRKRYMEDRHRKRVRRKCNEAVYSYELIDEKYTRRGREPIKKPYVKRRYRGTRRGSYSGWFKAYCNRKMRHTNTEEFPCNHSGYRKLHEYWYEIY